MLSIGVSSANNSSRSISTIHIAGTEEVTLYTYAQTQGKRKVTVLDASEASPRLKVAVITADGDGKCTKLCHHHSVLLLSLLHCEVGKGKVAVEV